MTRKNISNNCGTNHQRPHDHHHNHDDHDHHSRRMRVESFATRISWSALLCLILVCYADGIATAKSNGDPIDYLDESSVILITGAAGFIGSELALALHRTYSPKKILCVDRMGDHPSTQEELALFEFQRQRAFHIMQTLGSKGRFYRVDFRPMIPEYFKTGEVPVLDHIFRENPDITHIVHLADPFPHSALQAVPIEKDVPKAGMIEALLEQMLIMKRESGRLPHFTYASSYEVYPYTSNLTLTPLTESQPITTPSSLRGASKLIDEILAKLYFDEHEVYSVGLRFFSVYGPWSVPGSPLFEMAERAVAGKLPSSEPHWKSVQDFVHIDDAVDAVMAAMQFRPSNQKPHPIVVNVATGKGSSLEAVAALMRQYFPSTSNAAVVDDLSESKKTIAIGSIKRAEEILGYSPQVSLKEGIVKLLAWHFDRAYPYGGFQSDETDQSTFIASQGIVSCPPTDTECLKSAPVFPCSSECSHETQCTRSFYDLVAGWTQALTADCETVLYTVALQESLKSIPSAHVKLRTTSDSFVDGNCNIAFVSESSSLVQSIRGTNAMSAFTRSDRMKLLTTGKWILIPVPKPSLPTSDENILNLLPKLSPGLFFGPKTKRAIYVDPDILLDSIPKLLREASMQPQNDEVDGATAMLIGKGKPKDYFALSEDDDFLPKPQIFDPANSIIQKAAYRMVRIAVSDKLFGDGFGALLDNRWMVHTLQSDDARLFRCDVLGEVVQWNVSTDRSALEFVLGLHDMWSRVIAEKPWWIGDGVVTIPVASTLRRRLQEEDAVEEDEGDAANGDEDGSDGDNEDADAETEDEENVDEDENVEEEDNEEGEEIADDVDEDSAEEDIVEEYVEEIQQDAEEDDEVPIVAELDENAVRQGFDAKDQNVEEVAAGEKKRGDSSEQDDDQAQVVQENPVVDEELVEERDFSVYDTWLGVLSATDVKYFVRVVPSSEVGVVSLDDYERSRAQQQ